MSLTMG